MFRTAYKKIKILLATVLIFLSAVGWPGLSAARDTDIYQVSTKQNCIVLIDRSTSMGFGVYEAGIDYGKMYDYLFTLNDETSTADYIDDMYLGDILYDNHPDKNRIYLVMGTVGVTITDDGVTFPGDAGDPDQGWDIFHMVDTHTLLDSSGNISDDGTGQQLLTVDEDGYILLDGNPLPLDRDILLRDMVPLYSGSLINNGFGGLLNAPGYYFSGYVYNVETGSIEVFDPAAEKIYPYFFATGNWVNMQSLWNLYYTTNNPEPLGASASDPPCMYETVPIDVDEWMYRDESLRYPVSGNYLKNLRETTTSQTISGLASTQVQLHFSAFDVDGDDDADSWSDDYVAIYNGSGDLVAKYDNDNNPADGDGWSATISDDTVEVTLKSDNDNTTGTGYVIDMVRLTTASGTYLMKSRLDVAKFALQSVVEEFHGKINWGYASYKYTSGMGDGATINADLNPNLTDDANRAAILNAIDLTSVSSDEGTPMGEALQDVFEQGYWTGRAALDNLLCRKNYVISVTDGYASYDNEWDRIGEDNDVDNKLPIEDWDGDGWSEDPSQATDPDNPDPNYYDDVGHWMYTHSWLDKSVVTDPENSYVNVRTHHVAFGMDHPVLEDAADESGGLYVAAYNETQLVAAFYALALQMTEAVSFTSPVVSVDAANKIQNGDDLYLGLFLPQDNQSWLGNMKKYKLGDGSTARPDLWMLYDGDDREAIDVTGEFLDNASAFWADDDDANDSDNYGSADVMEDGVGEVLTERVVADYANGTYWERPIYTYNSILDSMIEVQWDTLSAADLNVADDTTRDMVINYLYGYTYAADLTSHAPLAARGWALGAIVHSRPVVIDYYDSSGDLEKRLLAVGSNDGMLHVFDEDDGSELLAFVPEDLLPNLQLLPLNPNVDMVDGNLTLYRRDKDPDPDRKDMEPKYLIFGEREGGSTYWCLDVSDTNPLNWTVTWNYSNGEIAQSWSAPVIASMPVDINSSTGQREYKDVVILTGGYDPGEDNYPEPFNDEDTDGDPYNDITGNIDATEWDRNDPDMDVNSNGIYDLYNLEKDEYGRGIYVFDIDDPDNVVTNLNGDQVLPFSVTYGATDVTTGNARELSSMKFCFPASPAALTLTESYLYKDGGAITEDTQANVLKAVYAIDIYANVYKINYDFDVTPPDDLDAGSYSATAEWRVTHIFSGNPGSISTSGTFGGGEDTTDQGRKVFYPPTISLGGSCRYFDAENYQFENVEFSGLDELVTLFFGTGDREHPAYTMIRDRYYSVYDDSSVSAVNINTLADIPISSVPYTEDNLLNLSENDLDDSANLSDAAKATIREWLTDDVSWDDNGTQYLEYGDDFEDDAKGWYIVLEDQDSALDHHGEKVLSSSDLFAEVLYFTTYQPTIVDPCNPQGNGFAYSMNYCDASAAYDLSNSSNASDDRYTVVDGIYGIPSDFAIVTREGQQGAMSMMGGKIAGPKGGDDFTIKGPGYGLELYYWRESDSQK